MFFDTVKSFHSNSQDHAISLLLANRPRLLKHLASGLSSELITNPRDYMLFSIVEFLLNRSQEIDFRCNFSDILAVDLECLILSLDVMLGEKLRQSDPLN